MYTERLKEELGRIADGKNEIERINREHNPRAEGANIGTAYACQAGALQARVGIMADVAASALRWVTEYVEPAEREAQRLESILEALGVDLDEETLATLELIGKQTYDEKTNRENSPYRGERCAIANMIGEQVRSVRANERDFEHDQADMALRAAGFTYNEDDETYTRGADLVRIELTNGRECRYQWIGMGDSGVSGEFHRLLALIAAPSQASPDGEAPQGPQGVVPGGESEPDMERDRRNP